MRRRLLIGLIGGMFLVISLTYLGYAPWTLTEAATPPPRPTIPATQTLMPSTEPRSETAPTSTPTPTPVLRLKFAPTIISQPLY